MAKTMKQLLSYEAHACVTKTGHKVHLQHTFSNIASMRAPTKLVCMNQNNNNNFNTILKDMLPMSQVYAM
eukprot:6492403-Amphidinium_carterae.2